MTFFNNINIKSGLMTFLLGNEVADIDQDEALW